MKDGDLTSTIAGLERRDIVERKRKADGDYYKLATKRPAKTKASGTALMALARGRAVCVRCLQARPAQALRRLALTYQLGPMQYEPAAVRLATTPADLLRLSEFALLALGGALVGSHASSLDAAKPAASPHGQYRYRQVAVRGATRLGAKQPIPSGSSSALAV